MSRRKLLSTPSPIDNWQKFRGLLSKSGTAVKEDDFDKWTQNIRYLVKLNSNTVTSTYPVAVEIVPREHNFYKDGTGGYASLYSYKDIIQSGSTNVTPDIYKLSTRISSAPYFSGVSTWERDGITNRNVSSSLSALPMDVYSNYKKLPEYEYESPSHHGLRGFKSNRQSTYDTICPFMGDYWHATPEAVSNNLFDKYTVGTNANWMTATMLADYKLCGLGGWYIPSMKELTYFAAQLRTYSELTNFCNWKKMWGSAGYDMNKSDYELMDRGLEGTNYIVNYNECACLYPHMDYAGWNMPLSWPTYQTPQIGQEKSVTILSSDIGYLNSTYYNLGLSITARYIAGEDSMWCIYTRAVYVTSSTGGYIIPFIRA